MNQLVFHSHVERLTCTTRDTRGEAARKGRAVAASEGSLIV